MYFLHCGGMFLPLGNHGRGIFGSSRDSWLFHGIYPYWIHGLHGRRRGRIAPRSRHGLAGHVQQLRHYVGLCAGRVDSAALGHKLDVLHLSGIGSNGVVDVHATTRNPCSFCETKIQVFNPSTILLACLETQCDHAVGVYFFGINPYGDVGFHLGPGL